MCQQLGAVESWDVRATSLPTLVQMVQQGLGLTLLPESAAEVELRGDEGVRLIPFAEPAPYRTVGFAWRPSSDRAREFRRLADSFV